MVEQWELMKILCTRQEKHFQMITNNFIDGITRVMFYCQIELCDFKIIRSKNKNSAPVIALDYANTEQQRRIAE